MGFLEAINYHVDGELRISQGRDVVYFYSLVHSMRVLADDAASVVGCEFAMN